MVTFESSLLETENSEFARESVQFFVYNMLTEVEPNSTGVPSDEAVEEPLLRTVVELIPYDNILLSSPAPHG